MLLEEEDDELSEQDGVVESYCFYAKTVGALGADPGAVLCLLLRRSSSCGLI